MAAHSAAVAAMRSPLHSAWSTHPATREPSLVANRRLSARTAFRGPARLLLPGGISRDVQMWDVGSDGASLTSPRPTPQGSTVDLQFELPAGGTSTLVVARAKVVYSSYTAAAQFRIGLMFLEIDPAAVAAIAQFCRPTP